MSTLYSMNQCESITNFEYDTFILAYASDDRAKELAHKAFSSQNCFSRVLVIHYSKQTDDEKSIEEFSALFQDVSVANVDVGEHSSSFLANLRNFSKDIIDRRVLIDISCIRVPEIFVLLKYLKYATPQFPIQIAYSIPLEYEFTREPFTSYHSFFGNLETQDLLGFGGLSDGQSADKMIVFLGFEGVLSSKVTEDIPYSTLLLVNNLPSFHPKYKDICVINNYELISEQNKKILFVPADNPFETYNFLASNLEDNEQVCIAPLSTKPVALGVCLYSLDHENVRVVYPFAEKYEYHNTSKVLETFMYSIKF